MNPKSLADVAKVTPLGSVPLTEELPEGALPVGDDYVLMERLGAGSMGEVWRARQLSTRRDVAIKVLRPGCSGERFAQEIEALGRLEHPGIARLYHAGVHSDGRPFLVMELVEGKTLGDRLKQSPLEPRAAATVARDVADALKYLASAGLVHRDIKPSNVLLDLLGRARITDFGLVKDLALGEGLTLEDERLGTPAYMAPEQVDGSRGEISELTDVYGAGAMLYHALTGHPPFEGAQPAQLLHMVATKEPDWDRLWRGIHRDLKAICAKAMAKEPARRYSTAGELAADLDRFLRGEPIQARLPNILEIGWRKLRQPVPLAAGFSLVLFALAWQLFGPRSFRSEISAVLREWPSIAPSLLNVLNLTPGPGGLVAFSPDGTMISTGGNSNVIRTATIAPWKLIVNGYPRAREYSAMEWSPDSRQMLLGDVNGTWWLWNVLPERALVWKGSLGSGVTAACFNADGAQWAAGTENGSILAWRRETGAAEPSFAGHQSGRVRLLRFLPHRDRLLAVSEGGAVRVWDLGPDTFVPIGSPFKTIRAVDLDAAGERLAIATPATNSNQTLVHLIRLADGASLGSRRHNGWVNQVRFSPDGGKLAVASSRESIEVWDARGEMIFSSLAHANQCTDVCFSPDGLRVMSVDLAGFARIWDARTGAPLTDSWKRREGMRQAVFSPDGLLVASGDIFNSGSLWDASCPLPRDWDKSALMAALKADGRLEGLRRAAWLAPHDLEAMELLASETARSATNEWQRSEASFLRDRTLRTRTRQR